MYNLQYWVFHTLSKRKIIKVFLYQFSTGTQIQQSAFYKKNSYRHLKYEPKPVTIVSQFKFNYLHTQKKKEYSFLSARNHTRMLTKFYTSFYHNRT